MKKLIALIAAAIISISLWGQQIEIAFGSHVMNGTFNEFTSGELSKAAFGISAKNIYQNWGLYVNYYSNKKKIYGDTFLIHKPSSFNTNVFDSTVYELKYMPYGYIAGVSYSFENRISVFAGAGVAFFRRKHAVYNYTFMPTSTGNYTEIYDANYSESIYEYDRKFCFEMGLDYDFLKSWKWSLGVRGGFNTSTMFFGQCYAGYNFSKSNNPTK